jgi:2,4-dienoyl-CoA reductase (NADPH2)
VDNDVVGPSPIKDGLTGIIPREMTGEEIEEVIVSFGQAARRAQEAGFDGVEVMAGHGYLINEFLSQRTNQRMDRWGGGLENRATFLLNIIKEIKLIVRDDFQILVKINSEDQLKKGFTV